MRFRLGIVALIAATAAIGLGVHALHTSRKGPSTDEIERMQNAKLSISVVPSGEVGTAGERMLTCILKGRKLHWPEARTMRCAGVKP